MPSWKRVFEGWEAFFHSRVDARTYGLIRIGYATLLLINYASAFPFVEFYWSEHGILPFEISRRIIDPDTLTLFSLLPKTDAALWTTYGVFLVLIACLLAGVFTRVVAVLVFVLLVSFQHRNNMINDGEDIVFRMFGFILIWMPSNLAYSVDAWWRRRRGKPEATDAPAWPLRLMQIQVALILWSSVWEKIDGVDWLGGTSMFYVMQLDDLFGRFPVPQFIKESWWASRVMSWGTLWIEFLSPILIWFKETRRIALGAVLFLHFGIDYMMNLFLFEWIMILGWLSFVTPEDIQALRALFRRLRGRFASAPATS